MDTVRRGQPAEEVGNSEDNADGPLVCVRLLSQCVNRGTHARRFVVVEVVVGKESRSLDYDRKMG